MALKDNPFQQIVENQTPNTLNTPVSRVEEAKRREAIEAAQPDVSFGEAVSAAFQQENILSYLFKDSPSRAYDPNFTLTDELYEKATQDIPEEYRDFVVDAVNEEHLMGLRGNVLASLENERKLSAYGWSGVGLRMAATILDPVAIAATVATEGAAGAVIWGGKSTRLVNAFRGAASGATANAALEAYLVSQNDVKDAYDILYGAAGGLFLGGVFGAMGKSKLPEYDKAMEKMAFDAQVAQIVDYSNSPSVKQVANSSTALTPTRGVGAAENPFIPNLATEKDLRLATEEAIEAAQDAPFALAPNVRMTIAGQVKSSEVNIVRDLGNRLVEDAVGRNRNNERMQTTAEQIKRDRLKALQLEYYKTYGPAYEEWLNDTKQMTGPLKYFAKKGYLGRQQFGELVSDAIEFPRNRHHPAVVKAAKVQAKLQNELLRDAKAAGVQGFETIKDNLEYLTRKFNFYKIAQYQPKDVEALLAKAITRANLNIDDDLAQKFAEGYTKRFRSEAVGIDVNAIRPFTTDSKEVLRDILIDEDILDAENADKLISLLSTTPDGRPTQAMNRLKMDMDASTEIDGGSLSMRDITDRDAEQLFLAYSDQMTGMAALARKGIVSDADFTRQMTLARAEADRMRLAADDKRMAKFNRDMENLEVAYAMVRGRASPLQDNPNTNFARIQRMMMDWNFLRLMGQVGFAQIAELGNALALGGFRGMFQAIPELRSMVRRGRNGDTYDDIINDVEAWTGYGADRYINQYANRRDLDAYYEVGRGDFVDKVTDIMQPMKRVLADLSGMAPITLGLERMTTRIIVQKFVDMAYGSRKVNMDRLLGLGIDEPMAKRIFDHLKSDRVTTVPSALFRNRKVKKINLHSWDADVRDAFLTAVVRNARQSIQQNDIGNLNRYMTKTTVQMLTQFRTFAFVAYEKQFLHNIAAKDVQATMAMLYSTYFAGLSYVVQTSINAQGRADKDEYLEERLSNAEIAKAAFQRSSYASLFPSMIDTGAMFFTEDPLFAYGRSSGLSSNLLAGVPTIDLADDLFKAASGTSRALLNPNVQWSQGHQRAINSLAPAANATGIRNALQLLVDMSPESSVVE
jgi:hypothetical protein